MLLTFENIKSTVNLLPVSNEIKQSILENSEVILNFRNFMSQKYLITAKDADEKIQRDIALKTSLVKDLDASKMADITSEYAKEEGYENPESLGAAICNLQSCVEELQKSLMQ